MINYTFGFRTRALGLDAANHRLGLRGEKCPQCHQQLSMASDKACHRRLNLGLRRPNRSRDHGLYLLLRAFFKICFHFVRPLINNSYLQLEFGDSFPRTYSSFPLQLSWIMRENEWEGVGVSLIWCEHEWKTGKGLPFWSCALKALRRTVHVGSIRWQ